MREDSREDTKGAAMVEVLEGMALVQRLIGLDPRASSEDALLEQVTETVLSFAGFEDCAVHLLERDRWRCAARAGWRDLLAPDVATGANDPEGDAARSGFGFLELVGRGTETLHIPDLARLKSETSETCGTLICAPVRACGSLYGVLCVAHSEPYRFGVMHERLMVLAGNIVAEKLLCRYLLMPPSSSPRTPRAGALPAPDRSFGCPTAEADPPHSPNTAARVLAELPDRVELEFHLRRALQSLDGHGESHALCLLDIDQLRVINDTSGHDAGDEVLRQLVLRILAQLRVEDVLVRLGGDEFGVLLWDCPRDAAAGVVEAMRQALRRERYLWRDDRFRVRTSFGVVCVCDSNESPSDLLSAAGAACHGAKTLGGDRVHLYEKGDEAMQQHSDDIHWVARINRALEDDTLILHYQPIESVVPATSGEGEAFGELLLRLRGDSGECVPAGRFLPAAERYGLSTLLDRWVVDSALNWLSEASALGVSLPTLWINLSGHSLSDPDFHEAMIRAVSESNVPGACLCFEITETAAIARMNLALRFIDSLRTLGCRFALDDFGSGMSSFSYLKSMNVDFVKIDGTFVHDLLEDPRSLALVRSINDVAHAMGKLTVAEWVESVAVWEALRDIGVDYVQGYLLGRPRPLDSEPEELESTA